MDAENSQECALRSIGNLVMNFQFSWNCIYSMILWYWVMGGTRAGPNNLKKRDSFLCPCTKEYRFSKQNLHEKFQEWLFKFCVKDFYWIWTLGYVTGWIFTSEIFNDNSRNSAYFPRPKTLDSNKSLNSNSLKLTLKESTVLWSTL